MRDVLGIVSFSDPSVDIDGMMETRSVGAISFLGRYRLIDFTLSNFTNSGIDEIQIYVKNKPRSLVSHVNEGNYNINSKRGGLKFLFNSSYKRNSIYNNDISCYMENLQSIEESDKEYVILAPSHLVYRFDFNDLLTAHKQNGNDITALYVQTTKAKEQFFMQKSLDIDKEGRVSKFDINLGKYKNAAISLDVMVMRKSLFIDLVNRAANTSSLYTFDDIIKEQLDELKVYTYKYKGVVASITSLKEYFDANMYLSDLQTSKKIFNSNWQIHTKTNDSCPTKYTKDANVVGSIVANGCIIEGTVINSVIGRNVIIKKGTVIKDCVILPSVSVAEGAHLEDCIIDKYAEVKYVKTLKGSKKHPLYVMRRDRI